MWVDVSFAPQVNFNKGKSIIGYLVKFCGATTTWSVSRSTRTPDSSSEAEAHGLNYARKENRWQLDLQYYLQIFKPSGPTLIHEDNTAVITLGGAPTFHKRTKHFGIEWYATREAISLKELELEYIATEDQIADFLTKPLGGRLFTRHRSAMMGSEDDQLFFGKIGPQKPVCK
jgi:hypothetical protein